LASQTADWTLEEEESKAPRRFKAPLTTSAAFTKLQVSNLIMQLTLSVTVRQAALRMHVQHLLLPFRQPAAVVST
jgi:hypothetical protein